MYEFLVYPYRSVVYEPYMVGQLSNNEPNFRSAISILALTGALLHLSLKYLSGFDIMYSTQSDKVNRKCLMKSIHLWLHFI